MNRIGFVLLSAALVTGCRQDPTIVVPPSFERPGSVAFFCVDVTASSIVPLAECDGLDGVSTETRALTALVAQTASGEVGSVDLRLDRVIDSDVRVPGFTFKRVGEGPTAVVVNPEDSAVTYVATFGSRRVEYYDTADFRVDVPAGAGLPETETPWVVLPDGPVDMVLSPDGTALYAALPTMGMLAVIPINADRSLGIPADPFDASAYTLVPLTAPDAIDAPTVGVAEIYERTCPTSISLRTPVITEPTQVTAEAGTLPEPTRLRYDGDTLLVLDAALPVVHRFSAVGATLTPEAPLSPGVPVRDLVFTPEVPAVVGTPDEDIPEESTPRRYAYAIDDTDGSVLVLDALEGSATFGAVLPVHVGAAPSDRIRLFDAARALEVLTPGFPGTECVLPVDEGIGPDELRGVFVAIALGNGLVEIVDVYDLDATCRGGNAACEEPPTTLDERVFIRRHSPRIGDFVAVESSVLGTPTFSTEGNTGRLLNDGASESGGPGLIVLAQCPSALGALFPATAVESSEGAVICGVVEPWSAREETWQADWEGAIPGATNGLARFDPDDPNVIRMEGARLCDRGVLGSENLAASALTADDPESQYGGDQVFIVSDPPLVGNPPQVRPECARFVADEENAIRDEIPMAILDANDGFLRVQASADLRDCYTTESGSFLFSIEVRVREAFAVQGSRSGFPHRVIPNEEGACRVDRDEQPIVADEPATFLNGRAFNDTAYINPWVAFTISNAGGLVPGDNSTLTFRLDDVPPILVADIGSRGTGRVSTLIEGLHYSETDQRLYVVDANTDGLIQYTLSPFNREQTFE